jgi:hypothetical protein
MASLKVYETVKRKLYLTARRAKPFFCSEPCLFERRFLGLRDSANVVAFV